MSLEDPARVNALLDACITRGLVEQDGEDVRPSRAWNAWLQKAAEVLNRQVAETGSTPGTHPVRAAVARALSMKGEAFPEADRADVAELLVQLELAHMSDEKREQYAAMERASARGRAARRG